MAVKKKQKTSAKTPPPIKKGGSSGTKKSKGNVIHYNTLENSAGNSETLQIGSTNWRPKGKTIVKDYLHGVPHKIIETTVTKEQMEDAEKNPLNRKLPPPDPAIMGEYWKNRALETERMLMKANKEIGILQSGQMLPADKAAPMDVQAMREKINSLEERLQPYKYEFTIAGSLVSVMVRPRAREVIPL